MNYRNCFILMPFTKTDKLNKQELDYVYQDILKKAIEEYEVKGKKYFSLVERFNSTIGSIISGIVNNLNSADLVIADLTGLNPNVMYELGVRHTLRRGTIILSQDLTDLPSDLRDYMTVGYKYSAKTIEQPQNYKQFRDDLHRSIDELISTDKYDSPVLNYLQERRRFRKEDEIENLKENAIIINAAVDAFYEIQDAIQALEEQKEKYLNGEILKQLFFIKFSTLTNALSELKIVHNSSILYENLSNAKTLLAEITKMFMLKNQGTEFIFTNHEYAYNDVIKSLDKYFVNAFAISSGQSLDYIKVKDLFLDEGVLQEEVFEYLDEYVISKAKELGVEEHELEKVLTS